MKAEDWIKVDDLLPKDNIYCLTYSASVEYVVLAYYSSERGFLHRDLGYKLEMVTHWMPLVLP